MKCRKVNSVFELLRIEKERIIAAEILRREEEARQEPKEPLLTWSCDNFSNYFYKQSDSIQI